jgi:hypothetical protein
MADAALPAMVMQIDTLRAIALSGACYVGSRTRVTSLCELSVNPPRTYGVETRLEF